MIRGEVWWVRLIVPLTSRLDRVFPSEAVVVVEGRPSKAAVDQVTTADKSRLLRPMGRLSADDLAAVERALALQLGLAD